MAVSMLFTPCPRRPATAIISVRPGSPWKMLEIVVMTPSIQPPKYPAEESKNKAEQHGEHRRGRSAKNGLSSAVEDTAQGVPADIIGA